MHRFTNSVFNKTRIYKLQTPLQLVFFVLLLLAFQTGLAQCPNATATPSAATICSGDITSIVLTSDLPSTTYTWTLVQTDVVGAIACASSCGDTIANTLTAAEVFPGTATYTVTPFTALCTGGGPSITFTITVNPIPLAIANPLNSTICSGSASSVALTSDVVGATFAWTVTNSGISGATDCPSSCGAAITQTLTATGTTLGIATYNVVPTVDGCIGEAINVKVRVRPQPTLANAGPDQTLCATTATLAGNAPLVGTGLWTLISGAGNITTPTSETSGINGLGIGPNTFRWTISNAPCPDSFDEVVITRSILPTPANAGPDQTICITTATLAGNVPLVGTGLWTLISGAGNITAATSATSGLTALGVGANSFSWTISNGACPPSSDTVIITVSASTTPAAAGPDQVICVTTATLAGNVPLVGTGLWTLISGTGNITMPTLATSGLTALVIGANRFSWTISNAPCPSSSDTVTITVSAPPTPAAAGPDQAICATTATLAGNVPLVGTGLWTLISGTGNITAATSATSGLTALGVGANSFSWTISNGACPPSSDTVIITVLAPTTPAAAGPDQVICVTTATLAGNVPIVGTGLWTLISGTGNITMPTLATSGLTALVIGANRFSWTISNAPCPSSSDTVTITVSTPPTTAAAGPDQAICATAATLAGNVPLLGTGLWTLISGTGNITVATSATSGLTALGVGANSFSWTISNGACPPSSDTVIITVLAPTTPAAAGPDQVICVTTATLAGNVPLVGTGLWTLISGTGNITMPTLATSGLTALVIGANRFSWTISNAPCPSSSDTVTITVSAPPTPAAAGPNQAICATTATLAGNVPLIGTGLWTLISGAGNITTATSATSGLTALGVGANSFSWTISNGACPPSSDTVIIIVLAPTTPAAAGPDQVICVTTATLAGNVPLVGTGLWALISGTGNITMPTSATSGLTALGVGANRFRWTISNAPCPSSSDTVTITVSAPPTPAAAGPDQAICATNATLAGNVPLVGTGLWTLISGAGNITAATSATSGLTALGVGSNSFSWTISNGACPPSSDTVIITVSAPTTPAAAGPDQVICVTTATLAGNVPLVGTGLWTLISGAGNITMPTLAASGLTALGVGANRFRWTISNAPCPSSSDTVIITVSAPPTPAAAGPDQAICGTATTLAGNVPLVGTGLWTLISGAGNITVATSATSGLTALGVGANSFSWTISNGACPPSSDTVIITVSAVPPTAAAGPDQVICVTAATLAGNIPAPGTGLWTLISGTGIITTPTSATSGLTALGLGANRFSWTISNAPCPSTSDTVTITLNATDDPSFTYASSTYCSSEPTNPTPTVTGLPGGTFSSTPAGLIFVSVFTGQINLALSSIGTYNVKYTTNGNCPDTSIFSVTITNGFLATFSYASPFYCQGGSPNPSPVFPAGASAGVFSALPAGLVFVNVITGQIDLTASAAGLYTVKNVIAAAGSCPADSAITSVTIDPLDDASFTYPLSTYCQSGANPFPILTGLPGGTFSSPGLLFISNVTGEVDLLGSAVGTYIISYTTTGTCPNTATFSLTITLLPDATFSYSGPYCQGGSPNPLPTFPLGSSAGAFSSLPAGLIFVNANTGQIDITASASGTFTVKNVIAASGGCPADSSTNTVTINPLPTIASAGLDQTNAATCGLTSLPLAANSALIGTGLWTEFSGDGLGVFVDPTDSLTIFTGTAGNTYVLRWTISNAPCTASTDSVTITFNQMPTIAVAGPDQTDSTTCGITSVTLDANPAIIGIGSWSIFSGMGGSFTNPADSTTIFTGMPGTTYVLRWTITNICGTSSDDVIIKFNINPTTSLAGADQTSAATCGLTSVTLAANSALIGTGNWSIFSGGGGSFVDPTNSATVFNGASDSTYVLIWTITNAPCVSSDSVTITFNPKPTVVTNNPGAVCSPATINLTLPAVTMGSTAGLTYNYFTDSFATIHISDSTAAGAGTYYIVGTTIEGCSDTTAIIVTVNSSPVVTVSGINLTCFNVCNGSVIATVVGGNPLYAYVWSSGATDTTFATTDTLTTLCALGYTLTVTDSNGCFDTGTVTLTQPTQLIPNITTGNISCFGICDGLSESSPTGGTAPYTFAWNTGSVDSMIINLCPGTYTVIVTDSFGCASTLPDTIVQAAAVLSNAIITNATCGLCDGQVVLAPSGGIAPYIFLWSNGQIIDTASNLCAGIYSVEITDSIGCSSNFAIAVNNIDGPTSSTITTNNITCFGLCNGAVADVTPIGGTAPYSLLWIQGGQTTPVLNNLCAGVYYIQIADSLGCSLIDSILITEPSPLIVNQFITTASCGVMPCDGSISISPSGGNAPYSILWSTGATSDTINNLCAGFYSVQITDLTGCSQDISLPLNNQGAANLSISSTDISCSDSCDAKAAVVASGGVLPYTYIWNDAGAQTSDTATGLCAGVYFVQVTSAGCVSFASVVITNPAPIGFSFANTTDPLCNGDSNGSIEVIPIGGALPYTYSWSDSSSLINIATGLIAGTYTVIVSDANGCSSLQTNTLVDPPPLTILIIPSSASCNTIADGSIDVTVGGGIPGYAYQWSGGSALNTQDLSNILSGSYTITVTDTNSCSIKDSTIVSSIITVIAKAGNDTILCEQEGLLLSADGSSSNIMNYQWYQIQLPTDSIIGNVMDITILPPLGSTVYYLIADTIGCANSDTITVLVNPLPLADAGADATILLSESIVIGGSPSGPLGATYLWNPSTSLDNGTNANPNASPLLTTTYTLTVTSIGGCITSDTITITIASKINFSSGISPNGDGTNDEWIIDNIELFPNSLVEVYNRWGELLFQSVGYVEKWAGLFKNIPLPIGTYYYIINLNDPLFPEAYTGPITILR